MTDDPAFPTRPAKAWAAAMFATPALAMMIAPTAFAKTSLIVPMCSGNSDSDGTAKQSGIPVPTNDRQLPCAHMLCPGQQREVRTPRYKRPVN